jgi:drug/metabolite transporter (DMT)-like permease
LDSPAIFSKLQNMLALLLLVCGVFCCATSVLMIKSSHLHPAVLSSYRLLLAAFLLSPLYAMNVREYRAEYSARDLRLTLLPACTLALHFISWAQGAQWTSAANASLIVNMVPVVMPFLMFLTMREVITREEIIGTAVSLAGVLCLSASDFWVSRQSLLGDIICFGSMLLFAYYLAQGRVNRDFPNLWLYLVPLYAFAGALCFLVALLAADPLGPHSARDYLLSLGLAVVPTIAGHSILNHAMKHLRGQIVSVVNLFQFLFAGMLAYVIFGEAPHLVFYAAGALVVGGALIVIHAVATMPAGEHELAVAATSEV